MLSRIVLNAQQLINGRKQYRKINRIKNGGWETCHLSMST